MTLAPRLTHVDKIWYPTQVATLVGHPPSASVLFTAEHASNTLPHTLEHALTREDHALLDTHRGFDIGIRPLMTQLLGHITMHEQGNAAGLYANVSRLLVDLNRPLNSPEAIPTKVGDHVLGFNENISQPDLMFRAQLHGAYLAAADEMVAVAPEAKAIIPLHSFTRNLHIRGERRDDIDVGVLADNTGKNMELARALVDALKAAGLERTFLNRPYDLGLAGAGENAPIIRPGEAYYPVQFLGQMRNKPYVLLEFAQEGLLDHEAGIERVRAAMVEALKETQLL